MNKMSKVIVVLLLAYIPNTYAVEQISFQTQVSKILLQTGVSYDGDVMLYLGNVIGSVTFPGSGNSCSGLWLDKADVLHTKYGLSLALSAINTKSYVSVVVQDIKWPASSSRFCKVKSLTLLAN